MPRKTMEITAAEDRRPATKVGLNCHREAAEPVKGVSNRQLSVNLEI
jgi:hypothetical protein